MVTGTISGSASFGRGVLTEHEWTSLARQLGLSPRELQVVQCICDDEKELCIARTLGISAHTVHTHVERIYRKLGVSSRCALAVHVLGRAVARLRAANQIAPGPDRH